MQRVFFLSLVAASFVTPLVVGESTSAKPYDDAPGIESPKLFEEVAKLFQRGKERVDLDKVKALLVECAEANERAPDGGSDAEEVFLDTAERLMEYFDAHRLEASDIAAIREWEAATFECRDDGKGAYVDALTSRIGRALHRVWSSIAGGDGDYEPRHALLCDVLGQQTKSLRGLVAFVPVVRRKQRGEPEPKGVTVITPSAGVIEEFLLEPANRTLWGEVGREYDALYRVNNRPEIFDNYDLVEEMLKHKEDPQQIRRLLKKFVPQSEELVKSYPDYAYLDRFFDMPKLRAVWNIVHAYGDDDARNEYQKYIASLRDFFAKRSDRVTVKWLEEVMAEPGKPKDKYVTYGTIGPPPEKK